MEIPVLSVDLIKALDKEFPLQNIPLDMPDRAIFSRVGRRNLIDMLLVSLEDQTVNQLIRSSPNVLQFPKGSG